MKGIRESYFDVVEVQDYAQPVLPVANYPVCKDFYPQQNLCKNIRAYKINIKRHSKTSVAS